MFSCRSTDAQSKRAPRVTNSRSFGTNVKSASSNGVNFDCPEEFGYYPHPSDCTQYYVCVFGGALLESCTGGLMYSHELQTCDWPRNVGCEVVDSGTSATSTEVGGASRNKPQQHVPSRIRFGSAFTSPTATQKTVTVPPQYHRSPPQTIQAQVQHLPPPPELTVAPNPVVTSRGQPKSLLESQEEIAKYTKLYAEAHETLPEEEDSERQQRVYRGQPSTVSQVQRDRDGILHQASINAIPNHGKIGSYTFGTAYRGRRRRDVSGLMSTTPAEVAGPTEAPNDSNTSSEVMEPDSASSGQLGSGEKTNSSNSSNSSNNSNNSQEQFDDAAPAVVQLQKYSSKISQTELDFLLADLDNSDSIENSDDTATAESKRRARQLRPFPHAPAKWPAHNYRSIDSPVHQPYNGAGKNGYSFGSYNPYLTPPSQHTPASQNYNQLNSGFKAYLQHAQHPQQTQQHLLPQHPQQQPEPVSTYGKKPSVVYTGYNLSLPPPPLEDDFRPIAGSYYGAAGSTSSRPPAGYPEQGDLLPYLIEQLKQLKERRKQIQAENFAYFHLDNQPISPTVHSTTQRPSYEYYSTTRPSQQVTPSNHYAQYSTMGGFYNNKPEYTPSISNYSGKLVSQFSIAQSPDTQSTTESNYFQYNIVANQKMKGVYNNAKPNQIEHAAIKVRPPVTPVHVTPNFNIVSAPNLAYKNPNGVQEVPFRDLSHLPVGISYASNSTLPESYQTFTKSVSSTVPPKPEPPKPSTTAKPQKTNFQFNINEFMANLKASDLASFNPAVNPLIKYFKQVSNDGNGNVRNALVLRRPVISSTPSTPVTSRPLLKSKPIPTRLPISTTTQASTTPILRGYESFVKSIQTQINKQVSNSNQSTTTSPTRPRISPGRVSTTTEKTVEYYDDDYDDGVDEDMLPPSRMPPYMPMSETMAPPRPQVTTEGPLSTTASKIRNNPQTGFMEATTTRRPFPNFTQLNQPNAGNGVPAFISFPSDIFQELKQRLPQLQATAAPSTHTTAQVRITTTTTSTTTPTPQAKIRYTVRPQRTRGQQKWQSQVQSNPDGLERTQNETSRGTAYTKPTGTSNNGLGGQNLNSVHVTSNTERQRVDSSSPSSSLTAQTSDNIFVQPSSQASPTQFASNRNYYNTSIFNHGGGYQTPQQAQQQQPSPFQQPQQQQQQQEQAPALPNPYDSSYYSVYDDDIDLYRDIEYQQQQDQQQHQQKPQPYQPPVRQPQQSTYRPLEILTTPTPPQRQSYNSQPTLSYSTDYEEDLNAQIEQDNVYDQPTPPPQRAEEVTIQTLEARATVSTTKNPAQRPDVRNYYDTFTTPHMSYEEPNYSYSSSSEYVQNLPADYYQSERVSPSKTRPSTQAPKSIKPDDYYLIANDVGQSTSAFKTDQIKKYTTMTPTRLPILKSSTVTSRNTNKITTTTTQPVTKPPATTPRTTATTPATTTTTTTLQPSSSKAHANKNFKQNVIIKLKTTTTPRTTQLPSTTTTAFSTTTVKQTPSALPTYTSNPFLKSKLQFLAKSLISAVAGTQSQSVNENKIPSQVQATVAPSISDSWALANDSANSSTQKYVETIYDESKNVQVHTAEIPSGHAYETSTSPKFLDFINAAAYGASNLVRTPTEKASKAAYIRDNIYNDFKRDKALSTEQNQSKRIQSYVLSDVKPQSFRATSQSAPGEASSELSEITNATRPSKAYEYSLESGSHGFTLTAKEPFNEDNVSEPLFERPDSGQRVKNNTTTTTTPTTTTTAATSTTRLPLTSANHMSVEYDDIVPTTYAPLRIWRNGRPTIKQAPSRLTTLRTIKVSDLPSSTIKLTSPAPTKAVSSSVTSTERSSAGQSFTARANLFKDNLIRVTSNPAMRFVSPYKSLESLLQDERLPHNSLRTTTRTRYANANAASVPFLQTTPKPVRSYVTASPLQNNATQFVLDTMANGNIRNFSISDAILSTFSPQRPVFNRVPTTKATTTTAPNKAPTEAALSTTIVEPTISSVATSPPIQVSEVPVRPRGRSRYTAATVNYNVDSVDEPTTYAPKFKIPHSYEPRSSSSITHSRRKTLRGRVANNRQTVFEPTAKSREKYESFKAAQQAKENVNRYQNTQSSQILPTSEAATTHNHYPSENEAATADNPRAEALIARQPLDVKQDNSIEQTVSTEISPSSIEDVVVISDHPPVKYLYSNKYRQQTAERTLAESLQNAGYIKNSSGQPKFRSTNVLEQLQHFLSISDSDESGSPQFVDENAEAEIKASVNEIRPVQSASRNATTTIRSTTTTTTTTISAPLPTTRAPYIGPKPIGNQPRLFPSPPNLRKLDAEAIPAITSSTPVVSTTPDISTTTATPSLSLSSPPTTRVSRVNNALKSSIAAAAAQSSSPVSTPSTHQMPGGRANKFHNGLAPNSNNNNNNQQQHQYNNNNANAAGATASVKCSDSTLNLKCNEIPSRNNNRNRGSTIYTNQDREVATPNRGTHPPRTRPTLKPAGTIVSKAQEFVDIYKYPPSRPDPIYPQPTPDKTAAKCRKDVCLLPDCYCGGKDIPGGLNVSVTPQIVLITFDDAINTINIDLYNELLNNETRKNPNGCPWRATFYISHEWTDYAMVQDMYSDGHEMASHTVS
ncbi:hypothetical protein AWZ03_006849 [Drosophila navojoa]|uniref:Chitin-binding type-2 domain-containing protein n=1 Tax=Drosophila navojoa TaxID=7232 RepID=A0A484BD80_DRONA|nr:hypothetical protein AWZ03_006849 [Drosophila navojoa]